MTVNPLVEALALAELEVEVEVELEEELELEHPAVPSRPATTTVAPTRLALLRLRMFIPRLYAIRVTHNETKSDCQVNAR